MPSHRAARRPSSHLVFALIFTALVVASHSALLTTPYFWDEGVALARGGFHYLTPWWTLFGKAPIVTRLAMLAAASAALFSVFLLAVRLSGSLPGTPALTVAVVTAVSPLFFTQSMLAQRPIFGLLFTALALWLFLRERHRLAALASLPLAFASPGLWALPLALGALLAFERRFKTAALYVAPLAVILVFAPPAHLLTHPIQLSIAAARRLYSLFLTPPHLIATAGIVSGIASGRLRRRRWRTVALFILFFIPASSLHTPYLDRDSLPVLPLLYAAAVAGFHSLPTLARLLAPAALTSALLAALFINPPFWGFAYDENLAFTDFTSLHLRAARYLEEHARTRVIATAWPLADELRRPELGYVKKPLMAIRLPDLSAASLKPLGKDTADVYVRFSRDWLPQRSLISNRYGRYIARRAFGYVEMASIDEIEHSLGLRLATTFEDNGQWVEIYTRPISKP